MHLAESRRAVVRFHNRRLLDWAGQNIGIRIVKVSVSFARYWYWYRKKINGTQPYTSVDIHEMKVKD